MDPGRKLKYGNVLTDFESAYLELSKTAKAQVYLREAAYGAEIIGLAARLEQLANILSDKNTDPKKRDESLSKAKEAYDNFWKNYNPETDRKLLAAMMSMYVSDIKSVYIPDLLVKAEKKYKGNWNRFAEEVFENPYSQVLRPSLVFCGIPRPVL